MKSADAFPVYRSRTCSLCRSKPRLNQAQEIALVLLVEWDRSSPMQTSNRNTRNCIAFRTAEHLRDLGLARIRPNLGPSGAFYEVLVTEAGRDLVAGRWSEALAALIADRGSVSSP